MTLEKKKIISYLEEYDQTYWTQLGPDIDGEDAGDYSGFSVSLSSDGNRVAIGVINNDVIPTGHVMVYERDGLSWTQLGSNIDGGEMRWLVAEVWTSLSSDGNHVAIGAINGYVRVYGLDGSSWTQFGSDIYGEGTGERSVSLSSDGKLVAIGSPSGNVDGNGDYSGHVRVYEYKQPSPDEWGNGNVIKGEDTTKEENKSYWTQLGLDIDGEDAGDYSGFSVSLSSDGKRVAIGSPQSASLVRVGYVKVYEWDDEISTPAWTQLGSDIDGDNTGDLSGFSVSLSSDGERVAIGSLQPWRGSGYVKVYEWDDWNLPEAWKQLGSDITGETAEDFSGFSVSLSSDGNRVAIGSPKGSDETGSNSGHVRVYYWNDSSWAQAGFNIDGEDAGDCSGFSVSLSSDGNHVAIGAPSSSSTFFVPEGTQHTGYVKVYHHNPIQSVQTIVNKVMEIVSQ